VSDTPQERQEAARVRRRWLTLGELLAIAAVVISALTFWNSYRERTSSETQRQAESAKSSKSAATLVLKATAERDGRTLALSARAESQTIQSQTITFPKALGLDPVETTGDARIERDWFESELVKARKAAGGVHDQPGDARLPVLITTHFLVDGEPATDSALFQIGYETSKAFLQGTSVKLKGLSRVGAVKDEASGKQRLEALAGSSLK